MDCKRYGFNSVFDVHNSIAAKQAASPADVVSKLVVDFGLPSSNETLAFAEGIFSRVPRKKSTGLNVILQLKFCLLYKCDSYIKCSFVFFCSMSPFTY